MQIKAKVRRLRRRPGCVDWQTIQKEREELTGLVVQLKEAQQSAGVIETHIVSAKASNSFDEWDHLVDETTPSDADDMPVDDTENHTTAAQVGPVLIEDQIIPIPSNGNTSDHHRDLELSHRILLADRHLNRLRDLIAEKSFQYSHVLRVAARKVVETRSRAVIKKLNHEIAEQGRMYSRCRSTFVTLGAGHSTLNRLKDLKFDDVSASTTVLNPNEPGSTRIKLSWIWQTPARYLPALFESRDTDENSNIETDADHISNADETLIAAAHPDSPAIMIEC